MPPVAVPHPSSSQPGLEVTLTEPSEIQLAHLIILVHLPNQGITLLTYIDAYINL